MSEIDTKIAQLNKRLNELEKEQQLIETQISALEEQKTIALEQQWGLKRGEKRRLSDEMHAYFKTLKWWTALRHNGYDPFTIRDLGENSVYIEDSRGGVCGMSYELVLTCEKVNE